MAKYVRIAMEEGSGEGVGAVREQVAVYERRDAQRRSFYARENYLRSGSIIITRCFPEENTKKSGGFIILAIKLALHLITKAGFMRNAVGHPDCCEPEGGVGG